MRTGNLDREARRAHAERMQREAEARKARRALQVAIGGAFVLAVFVAWLVMGIDAALHHWKVWGR